MKLVFFIVKKFRIPQYGVSLLFLLFFLPLEAQIRVSPVLGSGMVLQQLSEARIWGWAAPGRKVLVEVDWSKRKYETVSNAQGAWVVCVPTVAAGGPYQIKIKSGKDNLTLENVLLGEVWLCSGQSNMQMVMEGMEDQPVLGVNDFLSDAKNNQVRLFTVERKSSAQPLDSCSGRWAEATAKTVRKFSAIGYLYAKLLQEKLGVPVGIICSSWGGSRIEAWMQHETIKQFEDAFALTTKDNTPQHHRAANLFNGMIAPLSKLSIKGVLWYQGESNVAEHADYAALMAAMVENWRGVFNCGAFPFYYIQIAPYQKYGVNSAFLRDAQVCAMSLIPNSGMVCTLDLGEASCIHPADKFTVAKRLSYWSLSKTYNVEGLECRPTLYKNLEVKDSVAVVHFDNVGLGLSIFGKSVDCFEIAGADRVFYPAQMSISRRTVRVWSLQVKKPVAVRYAFSNYPQTRGFLYNTFGLPVPSFRSDDW